MNSIRNYIFFAFALVMLSSCGGLPKPAAEKNQYPDFVWDDEPRTPGRERQTRIAEPAPPRIETSNTAPVEDAVELMEFVEQWMGTPYAWGGNTRSGVDCSGFTLQVMNNVFGVELSGRRAEDFFQQVDVVKPSEAEPGDLVFFKIKGRRIDHVGVYLGDGKFAHASSSKGVVVSRLSEDYYSKRLFKVGRISQ
jgi:cell wall-associated NlpC family hydrolase